LIFVYDERMLTWSMGCRPSLSDNGPFRAAGSSAASAKAEISGSPKLNEVRLQGELADQILGRPVKHAALIPSP
ncbi:MAG: hypothetical protein V3576_06635, partial [Candidatus Cloacimonadota bacterium]